MRRADKTTTLGALANGKHATSHVQNAGEEEEDDLHSRRQAHASDVDEVQGEPEDGGFGDDAQDLDCLPSRELSRLANAGNVQRVVPGHCIGRCIRSTDG